MIGDPSGRSDERSLLDDDARCRQTWPASCPSCSQFLDFERPGNRRSSCWTIGPGPSACPTSHVLTRRWQARHRQPDGLAKESVRSRLVGHSDQGISYTEFSYMLLQAHDFYAWLYENEGCRAADRRLRPMGQHLRSALDLIRRKAKLAGAGFALTLPLLTKPDGTEVRQNGRWGHHLACCITELMSPYRFFQAWIADRRRMTCKKLLLQCSPCLPMVEVSAEICRRAP